MRFPEISTHGPARGPTRGCGTDDAVLLFQLTAPRGGRPNRLVKGNLFACISTHGPARGPTNSHGGKDYLCQISTHGPARGPTLYRIVDASCYKFQLTAPRGGRLFVNVDAQFSINFNSRPREGADSDSFPFS